MSGELDEHFRHLYDIHRLFPTIEIDDELKMLLKMVNDERSLHKTCLSAQKGTSLQQTLKSVVDEGAYHKDYEERTSHILFENVPYEENVESLQRIVESDLFDSLEESTHY